MDRDENNRGLGRLEKSGALREDGVEILEKKSEGEREVGAESCRKVLDVKEGGDDRNGIWKTDGTGHETKDDEACREKRVDTTGRVDKTEWKKEVGNHCQG